MTHFERFEICTKVAVKLNDVLLNGKRDTQNERVEKQSKNKEFKCVR